LEKLFKLVVNIGIQNVFKCTLCYKPLEDDFINRKGFPYCKKCNDEPPAHYFSGMNIKDKQEQEKKNQIIEEKNKLNQQVYSNIQKGKLFCAECGKIIAGNAIPFGESFFHENCFSCKKCGKALADSGFKMIDGVSVCASCAGSASGGGGFCAGCGQKLSGQFINAMQSKWHKNCFVCSDCQQILTGGYAEKNGLPFCSNCIQNKGANTTNVPMPGAQKVGFTVDPRTGKKKYTTGGPQ